MQWLYPGTELKKKKVFSSGAKLVVTLVTSHLSQAIKRKNGYSLWSYRLM